MSIFMHTYTFVLCLIGKTITTEWSDQRCIRLVLVQYIISCQLILPTAYQYLS